MAHLRSAQRGAGMKPNEDGNYDGMEIPDCEHEWVDATFGRELKSLFRCRKCHAMFDGSAPITGTKA